MLDEVEITRTTVGALNESTGQHSITATTVHTGRARLQVRTVQPADGNAPGSMSAVDQLEVHVPADTEGIQVGDLVTVVSSPNPAAIGRVLRVASTPTKTLRTAWRLMCEDSGL